MSRIVTRTRMRISLHSYLLADSQRYTAVPRAIPGLRRAEGSSYRLVGPVSPRIIMVTDDVLTEETMAVDEKEPRNISLGRRFGHRLRDAAARGV